MALHMFCLSGALRLVAGGCPIARQQEEGIVAVQLDEFLAVDWLPNFADQISFVAQQTHIAMNPLFDPNHPLVVAHLARQDDSQTASRADGAATQSIVHWVVASQRSFAKIEQDGKRPLACSDQLVSKTRLLRCLIG